MSVIGKKIDNYKPRDFGEIKLIYFHGKERNNLYRMDYKGKPLGTKYFPAGFDPPKDEAKHVYGTENNKYFELMRLVPASFKNPDFNVMAIFDTNRPLIPLPDKIDGKIIVKEKDRMLVLDKDEKWAYAFIEDTDERFIKEHVLSEKKKK